MTSCDQSIVGVQMDANGLKEMSEVRSFMSAAINVNPRDPAGTIRAITASAIGAVAQVCNPRLTTEG